MSGAREVLKDWVIEALNDLGGSAKVPAIAKVMWDKHEAELRKGGDLFYTWQYQMRWAAQVLQQQGKLLKNTPTRGSWALKGAAK